ncbi:DUF4350 domain-containing protein [Altererythrobacter sp. ZODW24]|uniref:DUF4350 domain-containing protein n=1 Tax=Altererythrobacter sp. ZODW24 TaxID=2185142 RepID=UPI000DF77752|nr:DUF4350 domain-containing protein [Altererythrobacter sp. ZODW24]
MSEPAAAPSAKAQGAFNPRVVLVLLLFGFAAFLATLYFIGTGNTGRDVNDGGGHVSGSGLNGYAALADYLEAEGHEVTRSRSQGALDDYGLLVLTPTHYVDGEELGQIIENRRFMGPTLIIMPKWHAARIPAGLPGAGEAKDGWVVLQGASAADLDIGLPVLDDLDAKVEFEESKDGATVSKPSGPLQTWRSNGRAGKLPSNKALQTISSGGVVSLVRDSKNQTLAGYVDDGYYSSLIDMAERPEPEDDDFDYSQYPVIIVAEPDLLNNWGFSNRANAELAHELIDAAMNYDDGPIIFDMTLNGLGTSKNLLTLAFSPPFLAATICLIIALIAIGWRAFRRFGPPVHEGRQIAFGKSQLVENSAGFIRRAKRLHLVGAPYASLMSGRIAEALGLRSADDISLVEDALAKRAPDAPSYSENVRKLREARDPGEMLRSAQALKSIERMLER